MQRYSNNYTLVPLLLSLSIGGGALLKVSYQIRAFESLFVEISLDTLLRSFLKVAFQHFEVGDLGKGGEPLIELLAITFE